MKPKYEKKLLLSKFKNVADNFQDYCFHPGTDFTRNRKLPMERLLTGIMGMDQGCFRWAFQRIIG